jgi:hypothetical protein
LLSGRIAAETNRIASMRNLHSATRSRSAIRDLVAVKRQPRLSSGAQERGESPFVARPALAARISVVEERTPQSLEHRDRAA